ncbi:MAG TPA: aspartate kinase [Gemmataceae bacterium]
MPLVVQKFGGTSVANVERIMAAARRAIRARQAGNQVVVVVSARGDTTDDLIDLAKEISETPHDREMDMLLSTGEQISIALVAMAVQELGAPAISFTGAQVGIVTDSTHTKARIKNISTDRIRRALAEGRIVVVAGFQGIDEDWNITTLGRGGSDTTAVALAAVLKHDRAGTPPIDFPVGCEIYTDVDGVYTTDPRLIPEARKIDVVSYDEMLELASAGAAVMHSRSIEFAKKFDVPVMVRSSFSDVEGTWIVPEAAWMREFDVCGVAIVKEEGRVTLTGVPDRPGVSHRVFAALAERNIVVDMIAQSVGMDGRATIGFTVPKAEIQATLRLLQPLAAELGAVVGCDEDVSKVSVVGAGMRTRTGVAERMFAALAAEGINLRMITTGDIKISVLVNRTDGIRALRAIHKAFRLREPRPGAGKAAPNGNGSPLQARAAGDQADAKELAARISRLSAMEDIIVSGVELNADHGRITVAELPDRAGNCSKVFEAVACGGIVVDMIVQNLTDAGRAELSFSVPRVDLDRAAGLARDAVKGIDPAARVTADGDIAVLFVYGVGMRTHTGVARKMFGALAARDINIAMINTSEVCISVVVDRRHGSAALAGLRSAFEVE